MNLNLDRSTWARARFGDVIYNIADRVDDPASAGVDRYVGLEHLDPGSMTVSRWGSPSDVEATKLRFRSGDVIFGRRRAYQKKVARADFEGICSAHAMVLRAKPGLVDRDFLPVFLSSDAFLDRAVQISVGSLSPTVNWKTLAVQEFLLPPLADQQRIADLLWAIEGRRIALEGVLAGLRAVNMAQLASLQQTGSRKVADVLISARAGATPLRSNPAHYGGGIPWLKSGEVIGDAIDKTQETITEAALASCPVHLVSVGATLVAMYGDGKTRGQVGRNAIPLTTNQAVLALVPDTDQCDENFLYIWMQSRTNALRVKSSGAAQKNLTKAMVIDEPFPDLNLEQQRAEVSRFMQLTRADQAVQAEIQTLGTLRHAMLNQFLAEE